MTIREQKTQIEEIIKAFAQYPDIAEPEFAAYALAYSLTAFRKGDTVTAIEWASDALEYLDESYHWQQFVRKLYRHLFKSHEVTESLPDIASNPCALEPQEPIELSLCDLADCEAANARHKLKRNS